MVDCYSKVWLVSNLSRNNKKLKDIRNKKITHFLNRSESIGHYREYDEAKDMEQEKTWCHTKGNIFRDAMSKPDKTIRKIKNTQFTNPSHGIHCIHALYICMDFFHINFCFYNVLVVKLNQIRISNYNSDIGCKT